MEEGLAPSAPRIDLVLQYLRERLEQQPCLKAAPTVQHYIRLPCSVFVNSSGGSKDAASAVPHQGCKNFNMLTKPDTTQRELEQDGKYSPPFRPYVVSQRRRTAADRVTAKKSLHYSPLTHDTEAERPQ
ncbi:hypothetical protein SRHO_G00139640 [Serrasalmus rhombeus]